MASKGRCMQMCPSEEIQMREKEKLLHPLEILSGTEHDKFPKADPYRIVKRFSRSAAGYNLTNPDILRPTNVLLQTIRYLFTFVINDNRFGEVCKYDFIVDRLRSIQQDMVIQSLPTEDCIQILQPIVKFHCLYGYRLCNENISNYDPVLNKKHLTEYIKRLLVCYDEIESKKIDNLNESSLIRSMAKLSINIGINEFNFYDSEIIPNRPLIEAIYIMSNLGDIHPLERYLKIPSKFKDECLHTCYKISICHIKRNWIRQCFLLRNVHPLVQCAGVLYLPNIRRSALQVMSHAYNSKILKYPIEKLKENLLYEDLSNIIEDCQYVNIHILDEFNIQFVKENFVFKENSSLKSLKKWRYLDNIINQHSLPKLLLNESDR